jgi:hypothetical protein
VNGHDTQVADSDAGTPDARAVSSCPAEEVVADIFDAFGRHHVQAVTGLLCDDVIEDLPGVGAVEGINNEREFLIGLFAAFPDLRVEVLPRYRCATGRRISRRALGAGHVPCARACATLSTVPVSSLAIPVTDDETAALERRMRSVTPSRAIFDGADLVRTCAAIVMEPART